MGLQFYLLQTLELRKLSVCVCVSCKYSKQHLPSLVSPASPRARCPAHKRSGTAGSACPCSARQAELPLGTWAGPSWGRGQSNPGPPAAKRRGAPTGPRRRPEPTQGCLPRRAEARTGGPRPATSMHSPRPSSPAAAILCGTRAFRAEYRLSPAQPQPDEGEKEQGLGKRRRERTWPEKRRRTELSGHGALSVWWREARGRERARGRLPRVAPASGG